MTFLRRLNSISHDFSTRHFSRMPSRSHWLVPCFLCPQSCCALWMRSHLRECHCARTWSRLKLCLTWLSSKSRPSYYSNLTQRSMTHAHCQQQLPGLVSSWQLFDQVAHHQSLLHLLAQARCWLLQVLGELALQQSFDLRQPSAQQLFNFVLVYQIHRSLWRF